MTETVTIDPVARLEGHYAVKVEVDNGVVVDAKASGTLFRGIETIVTGRDPRDAPTITSAVCGVCVSEHQIASALALDEAFGADPPRNGVLIRNIIEGATTLFSHVAHILVLNGPDYDLYGLVPGLSKSDQTFTDGYNKVLKDVVLPASRLCHQIVALFGGKSPHYWSVVGGGESIRHEDLPRVGSLVKSRLSSIKKTINEYAPAILDYLDNNPQLQDYGVGPTNFLSYGVYPDPVSPPDMLLKRGVIINGEQRAMDPANIREDVKHSWYTDDSGGNLKNEPLPNPNYGKGEAYTWLKAPRYEGNVVEVGPLARMIVSGLYTPKSNKGASIYDRIYARAAEMLLVMDEMESWVDNIVPAEPVYTPSQVPESGEGLGLWGAPRGALTHYIRISEKKIANYQVISPSTWNCSPRDNNDQMGPLEQALIGVPVDDPENPTEVGKTIRSYDPCLACSVHIVDAKGKNRVIKI
jgi:hydrogenase large subunit